MSTLTGTARLLLLFLRLDRWKLTPWVAIVALFPLASYSGYGAVFATAQDARLLEVSMGANPAFTLLFGPAVNLENALGFTVWRSQILGMFFVALMAAFTVTRHARASEDSGQAELLDSGAVGQHARLAAAVGLAWAASAAIGVLVAATLSGTGADPQGALALGGLFAGTGIAFGGVAAVTSQIASYGRTANTLAAGVLVASYVLRGLGDTLSDSGWLLWTSPLGWAELMHPATERNWAPFVLLAAGGLAAAGAGAWMSQRRDFASGLLEQRPGPSRGHGGIWRLTGTLNRGPMATWGITFALLGLVYGLVAGTMTEFFSENALIRRLLAARVTSEADLIFTFVAMLLTILAMVAGVFGIQIAGRFAAEEDERRAEWVLSGSLARVQHFAPTAFTALLAPGIALLVGAVTLGATAALGGADVVLADVLRQALVTIPAVWVSAAAALFLVGALPGLRWAAWLLVVYWLVLTMFGPLLKAPDWMLATSPYHVIPRVTAADADWSPLWWLLAIVGVLVAAGFAGYRARDLRTV